MNENQFNDIILNSINQYHRNLHCLMEAMQIRNLILRQ